MGLIFWFVQWGGLTRWSFKVFLALIAMIHYVMIINEWPWWQFVLSFGCCDRHIMNIFSANGQQPSNHRVEVGVLWLTQPTHRSNPDNARKRVQPWQTGIRKYRHCFAAAYRVFFWYLEDWEKVFFLFCFVFNLFFLNHQVHIFL